MSLISSLFSPSKVEKEPNLIAETLSLKNNFYVVKDGENYNYHKISIKDVDTERPIFRFDKHPPVVQDGIVIIKKKLYRVTMEDILHGVVRKSRELKVEVIKNGIAKQRASIEKSIDTNDGVSTSSGKAVQHSDEFGLSEDDEVEISKQANLYWEEQVGTLLGTLHKEEGGTWEIPDITQSRPADEVSAVQNS